MNVRLPIKRDKTIYNTLSNFCVSDFFEFNMGRSNQNFVYTPHKRRGPISAEFTSPGPAAISLPGTIGSKSVLKYHIHIQKRDDWNLNYSNSCLEPRFLLDTKLTVNRIWWAFIWWQMTGWHMTASVVDGLVIFVPVMSPLSHTIHSLT